MTAEWYYLASGEERGPVTGERLRQLAQSGDLAATDLVWRDGMPQWLPASRLGLVRKEPVPPPLPPPVPAARRTNTGRREKATRSGLSSHRNQRVRKHARPTSHVLQVVGICVGGTSILLCGIWIGYARHTNTANSTHASKRAAANRAERQSANTATLSRPMTAVPSRNASPSRSKPPDKRGTNPETVPGSSQPDASPAAPNGHDDLPVRPRKRLPEHVVSSGGLPENPKPFPSPAVVETDARNRPKAHEGRQRDRTKPVATQQQLFQEIDVQRQPTFIVQGVTVAQSIRYRILSRLEVERQSSDGTCQVVQTIVATRLEHADELSRSTFLASLDTMRGRRFTFTLNSHNEVIGFTGHKKDVRSSPVETRPGKGFLLTSVIDKDGWKELAELTFFRPENEESITGKTRIRQMEHDWSPLGSWQGTTTFVKHGQENNGRRFDFSHKMTYVPPNNKEGVLPFRITRANFRPEQASGSLLFDPTLDHVTSARELFRVKGTVGTELLGQSIVIQLEENQTLKITVTDQNPWGQSP